jgi:hypothetical protein
MGRIGHTGRTNRIRHVRRIGPGRRKYAGHQRRIGGNIPVGRRRYRRAGCAILGLRRIRATAMLLGRGVGRRAGISGPRLLSFKKTEHTFYTTRISLIRTNSKARPDRA